MNLTALPTIPLFRSLREAELETLFSALNITETHFKKGELLALQGEPVNRLIILLTGSVRGDMNDESGKTAHVEDIEAPNPLAILFLFGQKNRFPVQITAREDLTAIIIPKQSVLRMLAMHETLLKNYLDISADFAARLSSKLQFVSFRTIRQKVAVYLLDLAAKQEGETIVLDKSKSALAEYFNVARQSLEREITHLEQMGIIAAERREITIKDRDRLVKLINS